MGKNLLIVNITLSALNAFCIGVAIGGKNLIWPLNLIAMCSCLGVSIYDIIRLYNKD